MKNNYCVYIHLNKINNKAYIGLTGQNPEKRWINGTHYKTCTHFNRAILKYGWDNFEHIIFQSNLTEKEAKHTENLLILLYNTNNPKYGYNLTTGGEHPIHSELTKRKIAIKATGREISLKERERRSQAFSGKNNPKAKQVICLNNNSIFNTAKEAAKYYNIDNSSLCKCCNNKVKYAGVDPITKEHLVWAYVEDKLSQEEINNKLLNSKGNSSKITKCITTNELFFSLSAACKKYNLDSGNLSRACRNGKPYGKNSSNEKLYWTYILKE